MLNSYERVFLNVYARSPLVPLVPRAKLLENALIALYIKLFNTLVQTVFHVETQTFREKKKVNKEQWQIERL